MKNKTVLITGAARGIGWATAEWLADHGFNLILIDKAKGPWQKKASLLAQQKKVKVDTFLVDLTKLAAIKKLASKLKNTKVDVLVNNAGVVVAGELVDYADKMIELTLSVNLQAMILMTKYLLPNLKKSKGLVVNISSGAGLEGKKEFSVYCASKFGVIGFSKALAKDLKKVKVLSVTPGATNTALFKKAFKKGREALYQPSDIASIIGETIISHKKYKTGEIVDRCEHLERK
ncbi:SDR family oxidoreductase [bacterium]|jgi:short-subunit dehydrogenase|nr:SDR family oxidoreductase [bacterium]